MESEYISWLRSRGIKLFEGAGHTWRLRFGGRVLVPARLGPRYIELSPTEARELLQASGAMLLVFSSDPCAGTTDWWYVICDRYELQTLSHKTRQKINKARRACRVTRIDPEWLSQHGYPCYLAAHSRYLEARPWDEDRWQKHVLASFGDPLEYWGVFVGQDLAGYCECAMDGDIVATMVGRYDPTYFKYRPVNALVSGLCEHYVRDLGRTITNGNRSVGHDTNMQDFLIENGFRRQFCRLNLVYERWLGLAIGAAFPIRRLVARLPKTRYLAQVDELLRMEEIRRACQRRVDEAVR